MKVQVTVVVPKEKVERQKRLAELGVEKEVVALAFLRMNVGLAVDEKVMDQILMANIVHSASEFQDGVMGRFCTMVVELEDGDLCRYLLNYLDGVVLE